MKTINIYINKKDRHRILKMKQKYCLSLSTICDQIIFPIWKAIDTQEAMEKFTKTYLYKTDFKEKTSIKPKKTDNFKISPKIYTNAIKMFINNDYSLVIKDKDRINRLRSELDTILNKTFDEYWNFNEISRTQIKFIKENKSYVRKLLEEL